jgi:peptidoglycan/LPS O-acetylase OafA/YrhL
MAHPTRLCPWILVMASFTQATEYESNHKAPGLDLLRAAAVILVVIYHYSIRKTEAPFSIVGQYGWMGVDLFFVLSGFLIGNQLFRSLKRNKGINFSQFFLRRVLRTFPNFLAVLGIYFAFPNLREFATLPPIWKYLTFTQNLGLMRQATGAFSHAWSLCVEEQFYLIMPLAALFLYKRKSANTILAAVLAVLCFGIAIRSTLWTIILRPVFEASQGHNFSSIYDKYIYYPTFSRLDGLLVGVSLAMVKNFKSAIWKRVTNHGFLSILIGSIFLGAAMALCEIKYSLLGSAMIFPLVAIGFGAFLIAAVSPSLCFSRIAIPGVSWIATLSYAMYLTQKLVFYWGEEQLRHFGLNPVTYLGFAILMFALIVVSSALYFTVERPFLKLRDRMILKSVKYTSTIGSKREESSSHSVAIVMTTNE